MATQARNRASEVAADRSPVVEGKPSYTGEQLEVDIPESPSGPTEQESPVSAFMPESMPSVLGVQNAAEPLRMQAPVAPAQQPAAASFSSQGSVPAIPMDSNIMPGLSSGRVSTAAPADAQREQGADRPLAQATAEESGYEAQQREEPQPEQAAQQVDDAEESLDQKQSENKKVYQEDRSRRTIREAGFREMPVVGNILSKANRRFKEAKQYLQEKIKGSLKSGGKFKKNVFSDTIVSMSTVMPDCVSVGSEDLLQALRDPNSTLVELVNSNAMTNLDVESCINDISLLVDAINSCNIEVLFTKPPVNVKGSAQVRTLRAHYGAGIGLHPTQTKAYNADFDGDTGNVNLDQRLIRNYSRAMTHLIDPEGNAAVDPDFFPLDEMAMPGSKERSDLLSTMEDRNFAWDPSIAPRIADAYIRACNEKDWVGLLRTIDKVAGDRDLQAKHGMPRGRLSAMIFKSIYDYAIDRRGLNLKIEWASVVDNYDYVDPGPDASPIVYDLAGIVEEIAQGREAPNFQDFTDFFNKQYGDLYGEPLIKGKNVPFRLLVDFAKAIKRTDLISVGDYTWGLEATGADKVATVYDLWKFTCSAGVSKLISGRMHMGSHELAVSTQVRSQVLRLVPVPQWVPDDVVDAAKANREMFVKWMDDFKREYNVQMRMLNISQISVHGGMRLFRGKNLDRYDGFDSLTDDGFARAFIEVYGDFTIARCFPNTVLSYGREKSSKENTSNAVIKRYANMSVADFAIHNRLSYAGEYVGGEMVAKFKAVDSRLKGRGYTPFDVLTKIGDRMSKEFGNYEKEWLKATQLHHGIMEKIGGDIEKGDFNEYARDMLEFIHLMSPRMFDHFGMDSPLTFAKSKWGKKLEEAKTVDGFRSVLVSMEIEYRLSRASGILTEMNNVHDDESSDVDMMERISALDAVYACELKSLASSSLAWEAIVSEMVGDTHAFEDLLLSNGKDLKKGQLSAAAFWEAAPFDAQNVTIVDFLKSDIGYDLKVKVLCDVVKMTTGMGNAVSEKHMIGMLAHNPDPLFAGTRFDMDQVGSSIDAVKESTEKITSYMSKSPEKIKNEARKLVKNARKDKAGFERTLARFAEDPGYYTYVDTVFAADAISSIYEKDYSDSEKIHQQALVNGYFESISLQRNGGFFTHLHQADNAVVNVVGFDQLSSLDIVRVLGDPSIELHGYDEFGVPCVYSRRSLCGGDTIDDVLDYLEGHPRIALACRRCMTGISASSKKKKKTTSNLDGTARLSVLNDQGAGDSHTGRVFSLLNDRPRFLAMAALITPTKGRVGRSLAEHVDTNIKNLCMFVMNEAEGGRNAAQVSLDVEDFFGIADDESFEELIIKLRNEGAFDELEFGIDDYSAARNLFSEVVEEMLDCIGIVQNSGIPLVKIPEEKFDRSHTGIDKSSMIAYYDARQQLNGARTAKMINIEGGETKKNLVLKEYVRNRPDRFMTVSTKTDPSTILALEEATGSSIRSALETSEDGMIVIEVPAGWNNEDLTLEHSGRKQIGSIAKFLEIKREKGAETFNCKSKKFGYDGKGIIKFFKYGTRRMLSRFGVKDAWSVEDGQELRSRIVAAGSKEAAIPILADALMKADERLGYIDMDSVFEKSDYWNRADLMLTETTDAEGNVVVVIRTLEQLSVAFRNRLSDEAMLSGDSGVVLAELAELENVVGTPSDPMYNESVAQDTLNDVMVVSGVGFVGRLDRAMRPYSSSIERNYSLVWKLFKEIAGEGESVYAMPSRKEMVARSNKMFGVLKNNSIKEALKGVAYPNDKWVPAEESETGEGYYAENTEGSRESVYDYLGRPQDEGFMVVPGPQCLVLIDEAGHDDVVEKCKEFCTTVAFTSMEDVPEDYREDTIILPGKDPDNDPSLILLPFFDMRLNGAVSNPIAPAPGQWLAQRNNVITAVEDTTFEIKPGDASGHMTESCNDKVHFNIDGTETIDVFDLFPNVLRPNGMFADAVLSVEPCTLGEVVRHVLSGDATVDYGIHEDNEGFDRERRRYEIRLREYANRVAAGDVGDDSFIEGDCSYDSIVGFVKLRIDRNQFVFAPIVPFHVDQSGAAPSSFKIDGGIQVDNSTYSVNMRWHFDGDMKNQYIKFFEGIGASNKLMVFGGELARSRNLANGLPVDILYSTSSVSSRLFPKNKRIHTMISMLMIPRIDSKFAYNFGELAGAFPGEEGRPIAEALRAGTLTRSDWENILKENPDLVYHTDPEINSIVKWMVQKAVAYGTVNPSILLSTKNDRGIMPFMCTEFEAFMDSGYNFQNALMKFMNAMNPKLVPANIEDDSKDTLFKPVKKGRNENDYGVLQMMVPHFDADGKEYKVAENVYISFAFFGNEFSGYTSRTSGKFNSATTSVDQLNVASDLEGFDLSQVMMFARAGMSKVPSMGSMELSIPDALGEKEPIAGSESELETESVQA